MRRHVLVLSLAALAFACAPAPPPPASDQPLPDGGAGAVDAAEPDVPVPASLQFLLAYENVRSAPYFPLEGVAGVAWYDDGTLYLCDEKGGRVHGYSEVDDLWFQFDNPGSRFFRPVDIRIDHFKALVLDMDDRSLLRYDLGGAYQDLLVNFRQLDPAYDRQPSSFDVDLDGRLAFTDGAQDQVLLLDSFLNLQPAIGGPGSHREQFDDPSGIVFLRDGGFVVADRGNRRLQTFTRLGYPDRIVGGEWDTHNPMLTPQGVDIDADGNLFVADPAAGAIHVYDHDMNHLFSAGSELGLLAAPTAPIDVAVGPGDRLAVSDRGREALLVYRIVYR